jgi:hypothetical protein
VKEVFRVLGVGQAHKAMKAQVMVPTMSGRLAGSAAQTAMTSKAYSNSSTRGSSSMSMLKAAVPDDVVPLEVSSSGS